MNLYFCEQDVTNFIGDYLTEALVLASTEKNAHKAVLSLEKAFGLIVRPGRLRFIDLGPAPEAVLSVAPRHVHPSGKVLIVGEGQDV